MSANLKTFSILFGIVFLALGIMGFLPTFVADGKLLGVFEVDPLNNAVHLLTGMLAIFAATKESYAKWFFILLGIVYVALGVLGFVQNGDVYFMHVDTSGNIFHVIAGVIFLYLGLRFKSKRSSSR